MEGCIYFGVMVATSIGLFMIHISGIVTSGDECDFENLSLIILIGHFFLPLLGIPLSLLLIPDLTPTDNVVDTIQAALSDPETPQIEMKEFKISSVVSGGENNGKKAV
jgi:hypothetical protein